MHIQDIFDQHRTTFSFEFFPPKTDEASEELFANIVRLQELQPSFVSVTYGAGGSTRERTHDLIVRIHRETKLTAVSHLTCVCHTRDRTEAAHPRPLCDFRDRQHPRSQRRSAAPTCPNYDRSCDAFAYAEGLVGFLKASGSWPPSRGFGASVGVAGFPEDTPARPTGSRRWIISNRKWKPAPITSARSCSSTTVTSTTSASNCDLAGIKVPIVAGLMPITSRKGMITMAAMALGARFPAALLRAVGRCADDEAVARVGVHWATEQCRDLLDNEVRGIHFYTLNRSDATRQIYEHLGVKDSARTTGVGCCDF